MPFPANNLFILTTIVTVLALPASLFGYENWWWVAAASLLLIAVLDLGSVYFYQPLEIKRTIKSSLSLGEKQTVTLTLNNLENRAIEVEVFDHPPSSMSFSNLPARGSVPAKGTSLVQYELQPSERGDQSFKFVQYRRLSFLKLWQYSWKKSLSSGCRVYPNFAAVSHYALLALENRLGQIGINQQRRRGEGQEFHQLREYRQGDSLQKIDWKATSKHRKLISREFNDERNQEILLMLDCGHRMRAKDSEISHFDHSLNAALLLGYVALKQGDAVGIGTFSDEKSPGKARWIKPSSGNPTLQRLLNFVYDLQPGSYAPDYSEAAKAIMMQQRKRALIVIISNIRDEDGDDLSSALMLLRKRHLVLVASMREPILDQASSKTVTNFEDAVSTAAAHEYLHHRKLAFDKISSTNTLGVDVEPEQLSIKLVNDYLNIKASGKL